MLNLALEVSTLKWTVTCHWLRHNSSVVQKVLFWDPGNSVEDFSSEICHPPLTYMWAMSTAVITPAVRSVGTCVGAPVPSTVHIVVGDA